MEPRIKPLTGAVANQLKVCLRFPSNEEVIQPVSIESLPSSLQLWIG